MVRDIRAPLHRDRADDGVHRRREHDVDPRAVQVRRHPRFPPHDVPHAELRRQAAEALLREDVGHGDVREVLQALQGGVGEGHALVVRVRRRLGGACERGVEEGEGDLEVEDTAT